uniref:Putative secreted protein n=1 Tax=Anopheles triannulatus TaxID=58253 RepID=A0A2M4B2L9_9DIPT
MRITLHRVVRCSFWRITLTKRFCQRLETTVAYRQLRDYNPTCMIMKPAIWYEPPSVPSRRMKSFSATIRPNDCAICCPTRTCAT